MLINAVMMFRQHALVRTFEQVGAIDAARALTASQLGVEPGMAWHRLVVHAVLRCPGDGRYFVDLANWQRLRRRRRVLTLAAVVGLLGLLWVLWRLR